MRSKIITVTIAMPHKFGPQVPPTPVKAITGHLLKEIIGITM